jgi:hypothetical protein
LIIRGKAYSEDEAKGVLVKPAVRGLLPFGIPDTLGEAYWTRHREEQLVAMTDRQLEAAATAALPIVDQDARFVLDDRRFSTSAEKLRVGIDDQFRAEFAEALEQLAQRWGSEADTVKKLKSLEEAFRKELTRKALNVVCKRFQPQDLNRVRRELRSGFVSYSDVDVRYMRKNGEWEDVPLVIQLVERPDPGATLLSLPVEAKYRLVASAIYSIGRVRLPELLALPMPAKLLAHLLAEVPDKGFRALGDSSILTLLHSENDQVRKASALKCVRALPKTRLRQLLDYYISEDAMRYYNVIHWLDLGLSAPRDRAQRAAKKLIAKLWRA